MRATVWLGMVGLMATSTPTSATALEVGEGNGTEVVDNSLENDTSSSESKSLQELCSSKHMISCLKLSVFRGLERLSRRPQLELLPGLTVSGDLTPLQELPRDVTSGQVDDALLRSLTRYLGSLSLTVKVLDGGVMQRIKELGEAFSQGPDENSVTGRRKRFGSAMMMAGMMSGGSMMALGMSAIAMMAGKAIMTALLSLMMSAMMTMGKGGGGGGEKTTYEIIHGGHDIKHRSMEEATAADSGGVYPYFVPQLAARRNILIPLNRR